MPQLTTSTPHNGGLVLTQQGGHIRTLGLVPMVGEKQLRKKGRLKTWELEEDVHIFSWEICIFFLSIRLENPFTMASSWA